MQSLRNGYTEEGKAFIKSLCLVRCYELKRLIREFPEERRKRSAWIRQAYDEAV